MIVNDKRVIWMYLKENGVRSMFPRKNIKTRCVIKQDDKILAVGETLCGLNDMFSKETGRKISMARALKELYPTQKEKRAEFWDKYCKLGDYPRWKISHTKEVMKIVDGIISDLAK